MATSVIKVYRTFCPGLHKNYSWLAFPGCQVWFFNSLSSLNENCFAYFLLNSEINDVFIIYLLFYLLSFLKVTR